MEMPDDDHQLIEGRARFSAAAGRRDLRDDTGGRENCRPDRETTEDSAATNTERVDYTAAAKEDARKK